MNSPQRHKGHRGRTEETETGALLAIGTAPLECYILRLIMSETPPEFSYSDPWRREREISSGAFIGLGVISIVGMLGLPSLDGPLTMSVFSFAISVPVLAAVVLCMIQEAIFPGTPHAGVIDFGWIVGVFTSLLGISGLFFHFNLFAGFLFILLSILGIVVASRAWR